MGRRLKSYFNWMRFRVIPCPLYDPYRYEKLLGKLFTTPFVEVHRMDENRTGDALYLRKEFAWKRHIPEDWDTEENGGFAATLLEFMVSLAARCYREVMFGVEGYSPGVIFWMMIENLGLENQVDEDYDEAYVDRVLHRLNSGKIRSDGYGGLFRISNPKRDMRTAEYWYQMQWWASEVYDTRWKGVDVSSVLKGAGKGA